MSAENIKQILLHAIDFEWTLQGFGMLRMYLDESVRLHVWSHALSTPNVSAIHNHPWDFRSRVISGGITNVLYTAGPGDKFYKQNLICGEGGGLINEPTLIDLQEGHVRHIGPGEEYQMRAEFLHSSEPLDGTVSMIFREFHENTEEATVFYRSCDQWVSAEPRPATQNEILISTRKALEKWNAS